MSRNFAMKRQDRAMLALYRYLMKNRFLDADFLKEVEGLSEKDFHMLFNNLMKAARKLNKLSEEKSNPFMNYVFFVQYKDAKIIFFIMWGQGVCVQTFISRKHWRRRLSFSYEEAKAVLFDKKIVQKCC